jgi:hypothetical protein
VRLATPTCDLTARIMAGVRSDRRRHARQKSIRRTTTGWAMMAAAGMLVVIGVGAARSMPTPGSTAFAGAGQPPIAPVVAVSRALAPSVEPVPTLPVLGPIDKPPEVLGDTFPSPPPPRRVSASRVVEMGFVSVALLAP